MKLLKPNPFAFLAEKESPKYPLSKIYRSSFKERIVDAFWIINGNVHLLDYADYLFPERNDFYSSPALAKYAVEFGVLDYFGFCIPRAFSFLCTMAIRWMWESNLRIIFILPALAFAALCIATLVVDFALRAMISVLVTAAALPFIGAVALASVAKTAMINSRIDEAITSEMQEGIPDDYVSECDSWGMNYIERKDHAIGFYHSSKDEGRYSRTNYFTIFKCAKADDISSTEGDAERPPRKVYAYKAYPCSGSRSSDKLLDAMCELNQNDFYRNSLESY